MDVTSLLNSAAGQQKSEDGSDRTEDIYKSAPTPRNRTPWDAGGYSLPINTLPTLSSPASTLMVTEHAIHRGDSHTSISELPLPTNTFPTSSPASMSMVTEHAILRDDSHTAISEPPQHKFSDSQSSLSSFTSSQNSNGHSRFSSMSTVASYYTVNTLDKATQDSSRTTPQPQFFGSSNPDIHIGSPTVGARLRSSLSPTGSLETLASAAQRRQSNSGAGPISPMQPTTKAVEAINITPENEMRPFPRPGSPSDAILIKRTSVPSLKVNTEDVDADVVNQQNPMYLSATARLQGQENYSGAYNRHKRAISAPDFPPTMATDFVRRGSAVRFGGRAEPTPPPSQHPDHDSSPGTMSYTNAPDTPPSTSIELEAQPVICMYIPNCDTGSQPRKAISHIFGRNKMCTRLIPQHVWVHYCRKHYQRSRYRNPKEYAKLQCDLVQQQIRRVHEWSEENIRRGNAGGVVQDWGLAVRKREQKRLDDLGGASRKRRAATFDRNESDDERENGNDFVGNPVPATAVPRWLLDYCGKGYSTKAILDIFSRLHGEILTDSMPCFPDIEILPNIVVDQEEPKSPKGYIKRRPFASTHKRSQSLGGVMKSQSQTQPMQERRMSQPVWNPQEMYGVSPIQKRRRQNEVESQDQMPQYQRCNTAERPVEIGRRVQGLAHRPVFPDIEEHQVDGNDYRDSQGSGRYFSNSPSPAPYGAPLPAPTPQRLHTPSMAAHLENAKEADRPGQRPTHHRSQSDIGSFQRASNGYSQQQPTVSVVNTSFQQRPDLSTQPSKQPSSGYSPYSQPHYTPSKQQASDYETSVRPHPFADLRSMHPISRPGHVRHQSSPMIQARHLQQIYSTREVQPCHYYGYREASNDSLPPPMRILESQHGHVLYASHR
ncbi:ORP1 like protein [Phlyctema vagabunda]|uniref:ORP1 like protein n=1 Tax=Phlyctema vagabunda TaxID=108571 RepID=A0ABR4PMM9_9HELO